MNNSDYIDIIEKDFGKALGATDTAYREKVTFFIAHKDRNGDDVPNIDKWVREAETVLSDVGGGATSSEVRGAWVGDSGIIYENTTLVYSYATPQAILNNTEQLKNFLREYGRATNQGEVSLLLENPDGSWFFKIRRDN